jgi:hypothetical protein
MKLRTLTVLAAFCLFGCSDDAGATATEFNDTSASGDGFEIETGDETTPADGTANETTPPADTGAPPGDTMKADTPTTGSTVLKCGVLECDSKTQDCCITGVGACVPKGSTCVGARYSCTSGSNCASGEVCCVSGAGTGGTSCTSASTCPSTHTCESNADCTGSLKACCPISGGIKACTKMC